MKYLVICVTVFLMSYLIDSKNSEILVVLKHSSCYWNKKYIEKLSKPRKLINRTTSIASIDAYFKPGVSLSSPLYGQIISYKKFATQYKPIMLNMKADVCQYLTQKNHPLYKLMFSDRRNDTGSNLLDPCPIKGHRFMKPYYTTYDMLPKLLPTGMWRIDVIITKDDEEVLKVQSYYEIKARGIIEF